MSILADMLREEQERAMDMKAAVRNELQVLSKGYLSRKMIRGGPAFYLQYRVGSKIVSHYISRGKLEKVEKEVSRRKELQAMEKELDENLKRIQKALKA